MDTTSLVIAIGGTLIFFAVLIWKAIWFARKIAVEAEPSDGKVMDDRNASAHAGTSAVTGADADDDPSA